MAKRGLYYDLVRQQEKHGANEDSTYHTPNTAESQSDDSNNKSTQQQQRPHMAQG